MASQITPKEVDWFWDDLIPRGMFSMLVGRPNAGKGTLVTYLARMAKKTVIFTSPEDPAEYMLVPRLIANGVNLDTVLILEDRAATLPSDRDRITRRVRDFGADLVVFDPISSFMDDSTNENDGQHVRALLEAAAAVAEATLAAVLGVRHPGKAASNVMVSSREWGAVPRSIIELVVDDGPPERRIIRSYRDALGAQFQPRYYQLVGEPKKPKVFTLGEPVSPALLRLVRDVPDRRDRRKIDMACDLLKSLLAEGEQHSGWVLDRGKDIGLCPGTMYDAVDKMGVTLRQHGGGKGSEHFMVPPSNWPSP
jgi:hypothetical protein